MATKKGQEDTTLATQGTQALEARPSFIPVGTEGTDHITRDDIKLPRIALAQKMSPEVDDSKDAYIDGLREGQFFNSLTKAILPPTIKFVIIRGDKPRYIEFKPRSEGGGVLDMNVQAGDPRTQFTVGDDGKSKPPKATKFYDYVIVTLDNIDSPMVLSLKGTSIKTAKDLNGFIRMRKAPLYAGVYELSSASETNAKGTYRIFKVKNAGFVQDEKTFNLLKDAFKSYADKDVVFDRENDHDGGDGDDAGAGGTDFDPATM